MDTARCLGCGATASVEPGVCVYCGYTRGTSVSQRVAVCMAIVTLSALMVYVGWSYSRTST